MDPWSWTSRPAGQDFGPADMGGGGGGLGEGKSEDSLWRRDLSALGPFGAEANYQSFDKVNRHYTMEDLPKDCYT